MNDKVEQLADSVTLRLVARVSMIGATPVLGMLGWFAMNWLDGKFVDAAHATAVVAQQVQEVKQNVDDVSDELPKIKDRVLTLETNGARGRQDREQFQAETAEALRQIQQVLVQQSNQQSATTATLQAVQRQIDALQRPMPR